ncbi:MAG TPA: type II toxin-antitoxin system VapC family toxin [Gemmatimonadaceae bacterium]|nr:type II toxin-antitoxin system VapC family toxin [Gemmatimonadaceae bacterium]
MIIDTSVIIAAERGAVPLPDVLRSFGSEPVSIASITASELLHGCHRATAASIRTRRFAFVEAILDLIPVAPFRLQEARRHAELWAELVRRGRMLGPHDMLIAATALARGESLATLNHQEFKQVPGLRLVKVSDSAH